MHETTKLTAAELEAIRKKVGLSDLRKAVAAIPGAKIDKLSKDLLVVDAPAGHVWRGELLHGLSVNLDLNDGRFSRAEGVSLAIGDVLDRMSDGVELCEEDDCDSCSGEDEAAS